MPRLLFTIIWVILCEDAIWNLHAEEPQKEQDASVNSTEEQLEADLPDVIQAKIIDTTRIILEPRSRLSDPTKPKLIGYKGIYAKERLWNLPPVSTPQKAVSPHVAQTKNHIVNFTTYPSLPDSLYYRALFGGRSNKSRGFLYLDGKQLGDKRTQNLGDYNFNSVRGEVSYQHQEKDEMSLDVGLDLKGLNWRPAVDSTEKLRKEIFFFQSGIHWKQKVGKTARASLSLDAESVRLTHVEPNQSDQGNHLRFSYDALLPLPFQNPIHAGDTVDVNPIHVGSKIEYYSINSRGEPENWATIIRLYLRDEFTLFGPFALSMGAEGVNFRERSDNGENLTRLRVNPSLAVTTYLGKRWIFRMHAIRTTHQPKMSSLYFESDYISINPALRPEKAWSGRVTLKYHRGSKFEMGLAGFGKQIEDMVVLERLLPRDESIALTWRPTNIEARIYGGQLNLASLITNRLRLQIKYTHEFHHPQLTENIAYRPEDSVNLGVEYQISGDFRFELEGEFQGPRYTDTDETLERYILLKPTLSKSIGTYIDAFIGGTYAIGEYAVLHEEYSFLQNNVDFGVELKF